MFSLQKAIPYEDRINHLQVW